MTIEWSDRYDIGDVQLNHQHRHLFVIANQVLRASSHAELLECVGHLFQYIEHHFAYEEMMMRKAGFPDYEAHVRSHQALTSRLQKLSQRAPADAAFKAELEQLVTDWSLIHIPKEDAKLAEYLGYGETRESDLSSG